LDDPQVFSHLGDSFFGIFDLCRAKEWSPSYLWPHQRGSTLSVIQCLKRWHLETSLVTIVVWELCVGQTFLLIKPILQDTSSEHILQNLINPLYLTICLWVVCGVVLKLSPYGLVETLPELGHILCATIRYYASGRSMESENVLDV
jgi:hypothetical protein